MREISLALYESISIESIVQITYKMWNKVKRHWTKRKLTLFYQAVQDGMTVSSSQHT